jgi:hypothetical protein
MKMLELNQWCKIKNYDFGSVEFKFNPTNFRFEGDIDGVIFTAEDIQDAYTLYGR